MSMSNEVYVPYGDSASDTATLLLEAAEKAGEEPGIVRTSSDGGFLVPEEIAKSAGVKYESDDSGDEPEPEEKPVAKKAAAKKSTSKKG